MDVLVLRLIHIGAGAFWVGAVFTFFLFVQPAAIARGTRSDEVHATSCSTIGACRSGSSGPAW